MRSIVVQLRINATDFQLLYEGLVKEVSVRSTEGLQVRFPATILRPFVTHQGVFGRFKIQFDANNRFSSIEKID